MSVQCLVTQSGYCKGPGGEPKSYTTLWLESPVIMTLGDLQEIAKKHFPDTAPEDIHFYRLQGGSLYMSNYTE